MEIRETAIDGVKLIVPVRHGDERGFVSEVYNRRALVEAGIDLDFVQDNHSLSASANVVRGLHFQMPPFAQDKLIRVARGAILDVAVDIRRGSPTYGRHVAVTLSAANWHQMLVPAGFAHGFLTLAPDTEVLYKVTAPYSPAHDAGVRWDDPDLGIDWPMAPGDVILSERDRRHPRFAELDSPFRL